MSNDDNDEMPRHASAPAKAGHGHHHEHHHGHLGAGATFGRAFALGIALNLGFVVIELIAGMFANSLALIADASHNFVDVLSLVLAGVAGLLATRHPSPRYTYGLRGSTILAALANAMVLLVVIGGVIWASINRLTTPAPINDLIVTVVAAIGIAINGGTALLFRVGRHHDLNVRGAYLHMLADAAVSLAVVAGGILMHFTGLYWIDPLLGVVIAVVIFIATWDLLKESIRLALQAVPDGVDPFAVRQFLEGLDGVTEVHDLHIWAMSTTETAMTVHLVIPHGHPGDDFLSRVAAEIEEHHHIGHVTMQIETGHGSIHCRLAPENVV